MIPKIQKKVERETKIIRKEMNMRGTPLDFIFEGKTPNVTGIVANSHDYSLLFKQGYRIETIRRKLEEPVLPSYGCPQNDYECDEVFYISGIQCCGSGDERVPAVLNVCYGLRYTRSDVEKRVFAVGKEPLRNLMARLEESSDITRNIRAEILREIIKKTK